MNIGITGSSGFIGTHLLNKLMSMNIHDCEQFNRKQYDLFDIESMKLFVQNKDYIFHLAGINRASNPELLKINALGTHNLLEAIRRYSQKNVKVIYTSSFQSYGATKQKRYLSEETPLEPNSFYGLTKKFAEEIFKFFNQNYKIRSLVFRLSNVYGEGCKPYYNSVISTMVDLLLKDKNILVKGSGIQTRDFVYVHDVVNALLKVFDYRFSYDTFNVCTGKGTQINEVVNKLSNILCKVPKLEYKYLDESDNYLIGDISKTKRKLGFIAEFDIENGLKSMIRNLGISNECRN